MILILQVVPMFKLILDMYNYIFRKSLDSNAPKAEDETKMVLLD